MRKIALLTVLVVSALGAVCQNYPIGSRSIDFTDPARNNRVIGTDVYYPAVSAGSNAAVAEGQFPVVVIGHGFAMTVGAYQNWWEQLVPQGYIVALPRTESNLLPAPSHSNFGLDLAFLAARLQADNANSQSPFFGKVMERAALMGHSMGGGASVLGAANNTSIRCIVGLAPAETNNPSAISTAPNVSVPALFIYGTEDQVTPEATHALAIYNNLGSQCKAYARITGGGHCYFANYNFFCATGETNTAVLNMEREYQQSLSYALVNPWLRYFLYDDCPSLDAFQQELATNPGLGANLLSCPNDPPVITDEEGMLTSSDAPNYQWYMDGNPLPSANASTYVYGGPGSYQVGTVNVGECEVLSNVIEVLSTGSVEQMAQPSVSVRGEEVVIAFGKSGDGAIGVHWFDATGRLLASQQADCGSGCVLPVPQASGLKVLRLSGRSFQKAYKVL